MPFDRAGPRCCRRPVVVAARGRPSERERPAGIAFVVEAAVRASAISAMPADRASSSISSLGKRRWPPIVRLHVILPFSAQRMTVVGVTRNSSATSRVTIRGCRRADRRCSAMMGLFVFRGGCFGLRGGLLRLPGLLGLWVLRFLRRCSGVRRRGFRCSACRRRFRCGSGLAGLLPGGPGAGGLRGFGFGGAGGSGCALPYGGAGWCGGALLFSGPRWCGGALLFGGAGWCGRARRVSGAIGRRGVFGQRGDELWADPGLANGLHVHGDGRVEDNDGGGPGGGLCPPRPNPLLGPRHRRSARCRPERIWSMPAICSDRSGQATVSSSCWTFCSMTAGARVR